MGAREMSEVRENKIDDFSISFSDFFSENIILMKCYFMNDI